MSYSTLCSVICSWHLMQLPFKTDVLFYTPDYMKSYWGVDMSVFECCLLYLQEIKDKCRSALSDVGASDNFCDVSGSTVRCRYNAVNFLTNIHTRYPIARPLGQGEVCGVFCGSSIWLIFCLCSCNYLRNILQYWDAFKRHSTVGHRAGVI